jgi:hypothetical protein
MPGGTNLLVLGDLCRGSQTSYPYDAYPPATEPTTRRRKGVLSEAGWPVFLRSMMKGVSIPFRDVIT